MKVLCIGDPHFHTNNIGHLDEFIKKVTIQAKQADIVIIMGDLLHTHEKVHTIALNYANKFIDSLRQVCHTYVLVGNHDMISQTQFLSENHWMNALKSKDYVTIVDKVHKIIHKGLEFVLCPYVPPGRLKEALNTIGDDWQDCTTIFLHQEMKGCKMGAIISEDGDQWDENMPLIVSGHIHDRQWVGSNVYYTGSSMQHAFGESHDKTVSMIKYTGGCDGSGDNCGGHGPEGCETRRLKKHYEIEEINLHLPIKKTLYVETSELDTYEIKMEDRVQYRLVIKGNENEFKSFRKTKRFEMIKSQGIKIVFKHRQIEDDEKKDDESDEEIVCMFEDILNRMVKESKDKFLEEIYDEVR